MSFESEFLACMPHTITVEPQTGLDGYGVPSYGAAVSHRCLIANKQELVKDADGREIMSKTQVHVAGPAYINTSDRVTLPAPFTPTTPQILAIFTYADEGGGIHNTHLFL